MGNGAESRLTLKLFPPGYGALLASPTHTSINPMIIDTKARNSTSVPGRHGPVPPSSNVGPEEMCVSKCAVMWHGYGGDLAVNSAGSLGGMRVHGVVGFGGEGSQGDNTGRPWAGFVATSSCSKDATEAAAQLPQQKPSTAEQRKRNITNTTANAPNAPSQTLLHHKLPQAPQAPSSP